VKVDCTGVEPELVAVKAGILPAPEAKSEEIIRKVRAVDALASVRDLSALLRT